MMLYKVDRKVHLPLSGVVCRMDSLLPNLDCHSKPHHDKDSNIPPSDSICYKLPLILRPEEVDRRHTWNRETKRSRLHPSYSKINARRKMDSVQITSELSPMPYQAQLFSSSTTLKIVPLKACHNLNTVSQPLPDKVTKTKSIPFHLRNRLLSEEHTTIILDASVWASKTNIKLERKKNLRPSTELETQPKKPTTACDSSQNNHNSNSPKTTEGKTFKSLSLEEMSIRRNMTKAKYIKQKDDATLLDQLLGNAGKKRIPPLITEAEHKLKRKHSFRSKIVVASSEGDQKELQAEGQGSIKLGNDKYHSRTDVREKNVRGFKKERGGIDRHPYTVSKRERSQVLYEGYVCNHKVKVSEKKRDGSKMRSVEEEDRESMKVKPTISTIQERLRELPPVNETTAEAEEVTVCDNEIESVSEIMETEAICSPHLQYSEERVDTPESPNLLRIPSLLDYITQEKMTYLTKTFHMLDGDKDGHLKFLELESELPQTLSHSQKMYIKEVYDLVSSSTFFGLSEFCTVVLICEFLQKLPHAPREAIESGYSTQEDILSLMRRFDKSDVSKECSISLQSLFGGVLHILEPHRMNRIIDELHLSANDTISKVDFVCYIPYFLNITESWL